MPTPGCWPFHYDALAGLAPRTGIVILTFAHRALRLEMPTMSILIAIRLAPICASRARGDARRLAAPTISSETALA
jgi:hypothetical protein